MIEITAFRHIVDRQAVRIASEISPDLETATARAAETGEGWHWPEAGAPVQVERTNDEPMVLRTTNHRVGFMPFGFVYASKTVVRYRQDGGSEREATIDGAVSVEQVMSILKTHHTKVA